MLVMSDGRIVHETTPAAADLTVIGRHMAGHSMAIAEAALHPIPFTASRASPSRWS